LVGLCQGIDELASIESNEVVDFRKHMHHMCVWTARDRDSQVTSDTRTGDADLYRCNTGTDTDRYCLYNCV